MRVVWRGKIEGIKLNKEKQEKQMREEHGRE